MSDSSLQVDVDQTNDKPLPSCRPAICPAEMSVKNIYTCMQPTPTTTLNYRYNYVTGTSVIIHVHVVQ